MLRQIPNSPGKSADLPVLAALFGLLYPIWDFLERASSSPRNTLHFNLFHRWEKMMMFSSPAEPLLQLELHLRDSFNALYKMTKIHMLSSETL